MSSGAQVARTPELLIQQQLLNLRLELQKEFKELRDEQQKLFRLVSQRQNEHTELLTRVDRLDEDVRGKEGDGGLVKEVKGHTERINFALGAGAMLVFIGGLIGWFMDKAIQIFRGR
jgi:hypothetical protein